MCISTRTWLNTHVSVLLKSFRFYMMTYMFKLAVLYLLVAS